MATSSTLPLLQIIHVILEVFLGCDRDQLLLLVEEVEPELIDWLLRAPPQLERDGHGGKKLGVGLRGLHSLGLVTVRNFDCELAH